MEIVSVSDQIIAVLDALCAKFGLVVDWTASNIVPYLETLTHKLVAYEFATSIAWMCVWLVVFICAATLVRRMTKPNYTGILNDGDVPFYLWLFFFASLVIFTLVCVKQIFDIITCVTFPEKIILQYVQCMLKTTK